MNKENSEIMVSVIVLTYNHEKYIRQALDSILAQEVGFRYEILIGDDASPDGTPEILRDYQQRFPQIIRLFLREENLGATRNAYELLFQAKGDYLAFCEGDDFWLTKEKLQTQVDYLERNPDLIGCAHRCRIVDGQGNLRQNQHLPWVKEVPLFTLDDFQGIYLPGQTATIVKRNIFKNSTQDYSFLYRIDRNISDRTSTLLYLTKGPFGFVPEVMSAYRQIPDTGLTNQVYANNPNHLLHELEYTEQLEALSVALMAQEGIFASYYRRLYATAVYKHLKKPTRESWALVARTAAHIGRGKVHPLAFVKGVLLRLQ